MAIRGNIMNGFDIAIVVTVSVAVVGVIGWLIYRKVKHKGGCCEGGCPGCSECMRNGCDEKNKQCKR